MDRSELDHRFVEIRAGGVTLQGDLTVPKRVLGIAAFVHGSGSSRLSPRNQLVAETLQAAGLGTLLFDLLTREEEQIDNITRELRFDIDLLARRTIAAVDWLLLEPSAEGLSLGLFGASTGAAAALIAAAERPEVVRAVVSRGGRPDLAWQALPRVQAATLLIAGELDNQVIALNRQAFGMLQAGIPKRLVIVPGAAHLFEEPGTLEKVAHLACDWFVQYLSPEGQE